MQLCRQTLSDGEFYSEASQIRSEIESDMNHPAHHLGICGMQDIFGKNHNRLYHWLFENGEIPADNNMAERYLRPSAIAGKVSFGWISDTRAETRSILQRSNAH